MTSTPPSLSANGFTDPHYAESLLVHFRRGELLKQQSINFRSIGLDRRQLCDLELLLNRAYYPLGGYLGREDYESVLDIMRLTDGSLCPMPVVLDIEEKLAQNLEPGQSVAVRDEEGFMLAVLHVSGTWKADKRREACAVFGTEDPNKHPGVDRLFKDIKPWYVGGRLEGLQLPAHFDFPELRLTPTDTNKLFAQRGWRNVIGCETDGILHCAYKEMISRAAREVGANIFIQPLVGPTRTGGLDDFNFVLCQQAFVRNFPRNMASLGIIPFASRGAGPREALWKAIIRRNYGCTHFLVAEDQDDPYAGNEGQERFYQRSAAQELLSQFATETGITPVPLRGMVYVEEKAQYTPEDEVHLGMQVKAISPEELQRRLDLDLDIPEWFLFKEVADVLRKAYPPRHRQGFTIFLTGFSGAGKSTLAKILFARFKEMQERPVTLLDGDIVRKNLSSELTFSREHRNLNVQRIGFVASEITKNGGIALCAPIAPYKESRRAVRSMISHYGGFIEIYMSTPLTVCEQRDRKGIYAKARAGIMKGVTGIDDPYEAPSSPEMTIDTTSISPAEAAQEVILYLGELGYLR